MYDFYGFHHRGNGTSLHIIHGEVVQENLFEYRTLGGQKIDSMGWIVPEKTNNGAVVHVGGDPLWGYIFLAALVLIVGVGIRLAEVVYSKTYEESKLRTAVFAVALRNAASSIELSKIGKEPTDSALPEGSFWNAPNNGDHLYALKAYLTQEVRAPQDLINEFFRRFQVVSLENSDGTNNTRLKVLSPFEHYNVFVNKGGRAVRMALLARIEPGIFGIGQRTTICFIDDIVGTRLALTSGKAYRYWTPKGPNSKESIQGCAHAGKEGAFDSVSHGIILADDKPRETKSLHQGRGVINK